MYLFFQGWGYVWGFLRALQYVVRGPTVCREVLFVKLKELLQVSFNVFVFGSHANTPLGSSSQTGFDKIVGQPRMYQPGAADHQDLIPCPPGRGFVFGYAVTAAIRLSFRSDACSQSPRVMFQALQSYPHFPQDYTAVASRDNSHPTGERQS